MKARPPGLVIAAARSGSGKTIVTLGLMRAFTRRGLRVAGLKNGPDYIDPAFHAAATGLASFNVDTWAMPPALALGIAARAAADADLMICEGSMGLFDGVPAAPGRSGSSADTAALLGLPVLLVHDCSGQSQSAAALLAGLAGYDTRLRIAGVILNRIGSERHRRLVQEAVEVLGMRVLGALPRMDALTLPERHLGLVQAGETADLDARIDAFADAILAHVDCDAILAAGTAEPLPDVASAGCRVHTFLCWALASFSPLGYRIHTSTLCLGTASLPSPLRRGAGGEGPCREAEGRTTLTPTPLRKGEGHAPHAVRYVNPVTPTGEGVAPPGQRIAIARDAAFSFLYPHLLDGWRRAGAELVFFSPLQDEAPPPDADCCWLPGGYPELHAGRLAAAQNFLGGLRRFAGAKPVHGECGGYMVLGRGLIDAQGESHAMAGLLSVETSFARRKMTLGYRDARILASGARFRGHEFHYATVTDLGDDAPYAEVTDAYGAGPTPAGSRRGNVTGSFFHVLATL